MKVIGILIILIGFSIFSFIQEDYADKIARARLEFTGERIPVYWSSFTASILIITGVVISVVGRTTFRRKSAYKKVKPLDNPAEPATGRSRIAELRRAV